MPRLFRICSVVVHTIVVAWVVVAELLAVGALPVPRAPLTFVGMIPITLIDIPAPPVRRLATLPPPDASSAAVAPIEPPPAIGKEPEVDPSPRPTGGVEGSYKNGASLVNVIEPPPPPPPPPPQGPVHLSSGMRPPRKLVNVDPVYPRTAQIAHIDGVVILEATIDTRGRVIDVRVLRSVPLLDQAAVEAVRQWIYTPTLLNGVPVPIIMTVTVNFKLQER
jgi:periplasmic protein TonB